jgi:predicted nucleotidyltransferase
MMNEKIKKLIDEVKNICINNGVSHLYLFGSYAKGTERTGSDVDVVVQGVKNYKKLANDIDNIKTLETINIFNYDKISNKFLLEDIDKYGKIIY